MNFNITEVTQQVFNVVTSAQSAFNVVEVTQQAFNVIVQPPIQFTVVLATGIPGIGVPAGGTTGQVLAKRSDANYDFTWENIVVGIKAGQVSDYSFSGSPLTYAVVFSTPYLDTNYSISLSGIDARMFTYQSKTASGFVINVNSSTALIGEVSWMTMISGEQ